MGHDSVWGVTRKPDILDVEAAFFSPSLVSVTQTLRGCSPLKMWGTLAAIVLFFFFA